MFHAEDIIRRLQLQPLPVEGGFYRQTYQAPETLAGLVSRDPSAGARLVGDRYLLPVARAQRLSASPTCP